VATHRALVAVIDGNPAQRQQFADALASLYSVADYPDVETAVAMLPTPPKVVVVDEKVRPHGHRQLVRSLKGEVALDGAPIIVCRAKFKSLDLAGGGVPDAEPDAVLQKPFRRSELINAISALVNAKVEERWSVLPARPRLSLQVTLRAFNRVADLVGKGAPLSQEMLTVACTPLVDSVLNCEYREILGAVRQHDNYTYAHSLRMATLLTLLGHTLGLKGGSLTALAIGGMVHDIGKTSIRRDALNKSGALSREEVRAMHGHVSSGVDYLHRNSDIPKGAMVVVSQHHEKLDGSGYPAGLSGQQLNHLARMAAIVDVFTGMTDRRPYRRPMPAEEALRRMTTDMAGQLDLGMLKLFREMLLDAGH
jgi:HD-GYP domain-containing protein (c-di-GMP phosphodiesterase class II)